MPLLGFPSAEISLLRRACGAERRVKHLGNMWTATLCPPLLRFRHVPVVGASPIVRARSTARVNVSQSVNHGENFGADIVNAGVFVECCFLE